MPFTAEEREAILQEYLAELKAVLSGKETINEAVQARGILAGKNTGLDQAAFDDQGNGVNVRYNTSELNTSDNRIAKEREAMYLTSSNLSEREKIIFASAYFLAGYNLMEKRALAYATNPPKAREFSKLIEVIKAGTAKRLENQLQLADPGRGYELSSRSSQAINAMIKPVPDLNQKLTALLREIETRINDLGTSRKDENKKGLLRSVKGSINLFQQGSIDFHVLDRNIKEAERRMAGQRRFFAFRHRTHDLMKKICRVMDEERVRQPGMGAAEQKKPMQG